MYGKPAMTCFKQLSLNTCVK